MLLREPDAHGDADARDAREEGDGCGRARVMEVTVMEQDPADGEVEKSPEHIHGGRRESLSRRFGEGSRKWIPTDPLNKMVNCIREENAREETKDEVIPVHEQRSPAEKNEPSCAAGHRRASPYQLNVIRSR